MESNVSPEIPGGGRRGKISDIPGLPSGVIKKYIVERTNKAEVRPEEQSAKTESCLDNLLNEIQLKGSQRYK